MQDNMADIINMILNKALMVSCEKLFIETWIVRNCEMDKILGKGEITDYVERSSIG